MIFPDYENLTEERICQECYGYATGGTKLPVDFIVNPISFCLKLWCGYINLASITTEPAALDKPSKIMGSEG